MVLCLRPNVQQINIDVMKKKYLILAIFAFIALSLNAQEKWDYPIKPGMKEWVAFETGEQMAKACQIPLDVLNTIGTKELVTVCLNYPLFNNYVAFNDEREGVNAIIQQFNGLHELSQRKDGVQELIQTYADFPILSQAQKDVTSKEYHIPYKLSFLELVLSNNTFLRKMTNEELEELRKIAVNKYADKLQNSEVYSLFNIKKTMLLAAVIMNKQSKIEKQDIIDMFIKTYNNLDSNTLTEFSKIITE